MRHGESAMSVTAVRSAAVVACMVFALALAVMAPARAYAYYSDVATDYPALQELTADTGVLYASDIPEGTYLIPAQMSSYMCKLYNPSSVPDDSNATAKKALEDKCLITVTGNAIVATFYISKAYTALYMGTAEEAAMLTDDEGLDGSAYLFGTPESGYVYHLFSIAVPYLNETFELATYTGGQSFEAGKWYNREVMLYSTDEIAAAIAEAAGQDLDDDGDDDSGDSDDSDDPDDSGDDDDEGDDTEDDGTEETDDSDASGDADDDSSDTKSGSKTSNTSSAKDSAPVAAAAASSSGAGGSGGDSGNSGDSGGEADSNASGGSVASTQASATTAAKRGKLVSIAQPDAVVVADVEPVQAPVKDKGFVFTFPMALACVLAACIVGGFIWRTTRFKREFKTA